MIDLSQVQHPNFTLLSQGTLMTSDPTAPPGQECAGPTGPNIDRAVRSLRFRSGEGHGKSFVDALHAVDSNLDSAGIATVLSDPSMQRREAALQVLTPEVESAPTPGPSQAPRLA